MAQAGRRNIARTPLLAATVLAMSLAFLAGCTPEAAQMPPPPQVSVAEVVVRDVSQWDDFSGRIEAIQNVELRPRVSGYIESVNFTEGQEVKAGDVLFTIDPRTYKAAVAQAQAELARARTQAALGRSEAARAERLAGLQAISVEQLDQRKSAAAQAEANVQAAKAALDAAKLDLDFTEVRAPIAGRAGRALITTGNLVTGEDVLTTLVSLDKVHVHFDTDERSFLRYAEMARHGERPSERDARLPVQVGLVGEDGFPHKGEVDFLDNQVDRNTGTIRARAVLDNTDRVFTPGLFARVRLLGSGQFRAVLIDDKAVLTDQDRKYVYVLDENNTAQRRDIVPGRVADGLRIVEQGLNAGDRVIVNGVQKVFFPGMPVDAQPVAMATDGVPSPSVDLAALSPQQK
ncbi:efflux RND transporter periplasmic adaptor subunit [Chiayiivirga flava]|uniref:Multidrug efflux system membrane fusion protein n=1 Tax=Chiayiivirga flava TaxID=659595 RepID=A0A7W8D553_9GAMM|nr:efflux RND transporter periplasmic adaptor subunit [Chiayiivirga flava]MBB5208105.1 multidrug efflux system membrane fusion protein [Chiayiivirga flava]